MNVKNNKAYLFVLIIFIWNMFFYYLQSTLDLYKVINYIFWPVILISSILLFSNDYKRNKYKKIVFQDVIIFTLFYVIVYYLLGFLVDFQKSPLDFSFIGIIKNLINYVLIRAMMESVKYFLIKENNTKIFLVIVTILFIILNVDFKYLIRLMEVPRELFKYLSSNVLTSIIYGVVGTYVIKYSDVKTSLILQLTPLILMYVIPISPNLDWYLYSIFHIVYLLGLYLYLKYEIAKKDDLEKEAKSSLLSFVPFLLVFTILICFVLGIFNYVPIGVMSNSMKPVFERGDIIVYNKINNPKKIKVNDIVCYQLDKIKVMHRVVKIEEVDGKRYFTFKGDNLITNDPLKVKEEQLIGKIMFSVPMLGYPSVWLYELLN